MDELIQKYLDGELTEQEAAVLSGALAGDPSLDAELRSYERLLAAAAADIERDPSPGFEERVMERVTASAGRSAAGPLTAGKVVEDRDGRSIGSWGGAGWFRSWRPRLALAAGVVFVFALGYVTARRGGPGAPATPPSANDDGQRARVAAAQTIAPAPLRLVRLVYVPPDDDVQRVTVAGTFNGWDPEGTELRKEGGAWVVQLVLPPQTYEYMFVENGQQWVTDPLALETRDDGFGRQNAVLDLTL